MRLCGTSDDLLFAFVDGIEPHLEEHVAECDECQDFLAELWVGELNTDLATPVVRQNRILPSAAGTSIDVVAPSLTMKIVPLSPFSGRPPSAGGENRGSRHVPVHAASGSIFSPSLVSL